MTIVEGLFINKNFIRFTGSLSLFFPRSCWHYVVFFCFESNAIFCTFDDHCWKVVYWSKLHSLHSLHFLRSLVVCFLFWNQCYFFTFMYALIIAIYLLIRTLFAPLVRNNVLRSLVVTHRNKSFVVSYWQFVYLRKLY